jgi:hypothetical protein
MFSRLAAGDGGGEQLAAERHHVSRLLIWVD